jgi:hypothetical protein
LGLPRLANLVPLACLRAGASLSRLMDPLITEITTSDSFQARLYSIASSVDCPWSSTIAEINTHTRIVKAWEGDLCARCSSQGKGVRDFRGDKVGGAGGVTLRRHSPCHGTGPSTETGPISLSLSLSLSLTAIWIPSQETAVQFRARM